MELDSRIKEGKRPLTCFDVKEAIQFIGKECYLSNSFSDYADLNNVTAKRILDDVSNTSIPYSSNPAGIYCYCLPCEWVEQPKTPEFEPYTLETFEKEFNIGDVVFFREKDDDSAEGKYYKCMYSGYIQKPENKFLILLGGWLFDFTDLFFLYEIYRNGTWEPFGRKTKEGPNK